MSLSIDELLELVALRKVEDAGLWDTAISYEAANGRLQHIQGRRTSSQLAYTLAGNFLLEEPPNVAGARFVLEGARQLDNERGVGTPGTDALAALSEYEASFILMDADIIDAPDVEEGEGDVV